MSEVIFTGFGIDILKEIMNILSDMMLELLL